MYAVCPCAPVKHSTLDGNGKHVKTTIPTEQTPPSNVGNDGKWQCAAHTHTQACYVYQEGWRQLPNWNIPVLTASSQFSGFRKRKKANRFSISHHGFRALYANDGATEKTEECHFLPFDLMRLSVNYLILYFKWNASHFDDKTNIGLRLHETHATSAHHETLLSRIMGARAEQFSSRTRVDDMEWIRVNLPTR